jgi:transcription elongation factor Elf1
MPIPLVTQEMFDQLKQEQNKPEQCPRCESEDLCVSTHSSGPSASFIADCIACGQQWRGSVENGELTGRCLIPPTSSKGAE